MILLFDQKEKKFNITILASDMSSLHESTVISFLIVKNI
jgi:hypothetical protein